MLYLFFCYTSRAERQSFAVSGSKELTKLYNLHLFITKTNSNKYKINSNKYKPKVINTVQTVTNISQKVTNIMYKVTNIM